MNRNEQLKKDALDIINTAIRAADPFDSTAAILRRLKLDPDKRLTVFSVGKAAIPMARAAESVLGAVTGYMLPVVASAFLVWKNKDAFGGGDIKLLAALGAWLGMELVIYTMILASVLFVLYALARRMRVGAFGPAITIAAIMIAFYFF